MSATSTIANIGSKIRSFRERLNKSQEEVASEAGITQAYLCQIERGEKIPSIRTLEKIAKGFGVPPYYLLRDEKDAREDLEILLNGLNKFLDSDLTTEDLAGLLKVLKVLESRKERIYTRYRKKAEV